MMQQQSSTPPQSPTGSSHQEEPQNTTSSTNTGHASTATKSNHSGNAIVKKDKAKKVRRRVDGSPYTPIEWTRPVKRLVLIRHGQSLGQAAHHKHGWDRKTDVRLRDCPLTRNGQHQAKQLSSRFVASAAPSGMTEDDDSCSNARVWNQIELVVSSPLTRALHTALLAFGNHPINILVSYEIREIGSRMIPENIPRDMKSVLGDLKLLLTNGRCVITTTSTKMKTNKNKENETDHTDTDIDTETDNHDDDRTFIQRPSGPPTSVATSVLDVATLQPKDWPSDSRPKVVQKDRIKSFLQYLYHDRPENSIAVVCHYNVIRSIVVDNPNSSAAAAAASGDGAASTLRPQNAEPIYCYLYHNGDCCLAPNDS